MAYPTSNPTALEQFFPDGTDISNATYYSIVSATSDTGFAWKLNSFSTGSSSGAVSSQVAAQIASLQNGVVDALTSSANAQTVAIAANSNAVSASNNAGFALAAANSAQSSVSVIVETTGKYKGFVSATIGYDYGFDAFKLKPGGVYATPINHPDGPYNFKFTEALVPHDPEVSHYYRADNVYGTIVYWFHEETGTRKTAQLLTGATPAQAASAPYVGLGGWKLL